LRFLQLGSRRFEELGLAERVRFTETVSIAEVAPIIENADLGVVPKRTDGFGNEALSTKVLEFMTLGVPVVVSDSKVDRYYFTDQVVTFFKGNDEASLAECLLEMVQNPAKREAQIKRADDFVRALDWDLRKSEYLALVDTLVRSINAGVNATGDLPVSRIISKDPWQRYILLSCHRSLTVFFITIYRSNFAIIHTPHVINRRFHDGFSGNRRGGVHWVVPGAQAS
jgi:hypothetical protein